MVISCSTCEKEEKECIQVKYLIYAVCRDFKFVVIYAFFSTKCAFQKFQSSQQNGFFLVWISRLSAWLDYLFPDRTTLTRNSILATPCISFKMFIVLSIQTFEPNSYSTHYKSCLVCMSSVFPPHGRVILFSHQKLYYIITFYQQSLLGALMFL